ncbi:MAG: phage holin family protein [Campylobacteraceae bacterium]|jgi:hypothetical protein|nr:phage holin family protein [Campylobacteraceae bacterium]
MNLDKITAIWLLTVAIIGGALRLMSRKEKPKDARQRITEFCIGLIGSVFTAYLTFEFVYGYFENVRVAVSVAGIAAWMGTDALIALKTIIFEYLKRKTGV